MPIPSRLLSLLIVAALTPALAHAQFLPKIPPAPAPPPEYVPPAPPPPPPARPDPAPPPPAPEPLPSIIKKDAAGAIVPVTGLLELAAIAAFNFPEETRAKIATSEAARAADFDTKLPDKLAQVVEAYKSLEGVDKISDMGQLLGLRDLAEKLNTERLGERLLKDSAINAIQKQRIETVVKDYQMALSEERGKSTGADFVKISRLVVGDVLGERACEWFGAVDRRLEAAAPKLETIVGRMKLTTDAVAALPGIKQAIASNAGTGAEAREARLKPLRNYFYNTLSPEQQKALIDATEAK